MRVMGGGSSTQTWAASLSFSQLLSASLASVRSDEAWPECSLPPNQGRVAAPPHGSRPPPTHPAAWRLTPWSVVASCRRSRPSQTPRPAPLPSPRRRPCKRLDPRGVPQRRAAQDHHVCVQRHAGVVLARSRGQGQYWSLFEDIEPAVEGVEARVRPFVLDATAQGAQLRGRRVRAQRVGGLAEFEVALTVLSEE